MRPEPHDHEALRHLKTIVVLHLGAGACLVLPGVMLLGLWIVAVPLLLTGGALLLAGWGLHRRLRLARALACVMAVVALPFVPVGTAFGLYVLRVLATARGRRAFEHPDRTIRARPFTAILAAQVSLAGCALWGILVLTHIAVPRLGDAYRAAATQDVAP